MYITVKQLAEKVNNLERFYMNEYIKELKKEPDMQQDPTFEIVILDDYNNIIYRHYKECTKEKAEILAKTACEFYKTLDKCNYQYKVYKIK